MNKKLLILNLALAAALATVGVRIRNASLASKAHANQTLSKSVPRAGAPPYPTIPPAPPVEPAGYVEVARKMLFDPTRDSTIIVEPPPPPPPPPEPEPVPPFPAYQGKANLGDGTVYFMAPAGAKKYERVRVGDDIGPFKLTAATAKEVTLEWNGQTFTKALDDLRAKAPLKVAQAAAAPSPVPVPTPTPPPQEVGPAGELPYGNRACAPNDSYPAGAVVSGYKKDIMRTPFGESCKWIPVQQ